MQTLGIALLVISLLATFFGAMQRRKGKKILATPFRRTGELAASGQGTVSCEGAVQVQAPAIAPVSGKPCVYYEIELVQEWSKSVATEDGVKEEKGTTTLSTTKNGAVFYVNDGSGPMGVDPRQGMDIELEKSFEQSQAMSHGTFTMGSFHAHVPHAGDGKSGRSVKVIEKIVPCDGKLFVLGHVDPFRNITKPQTMLGSLMASRKGRDSLLGATKRNATIGFVAGALFMLPGGAMAAFGEPMSTEALKGCQIQDESVAGAPCTGKIYGDYGSDVTFTVTKAATFQISGGAPVGKKLPLIPKLDIKDAAGKAMIKDAPGTAKLDLAPGTYTINIRDSIPGAAKNFKGGFSYEVAVKRVALAAAPVVAAAPAVLPLAANVAKATPAATDTAAAANEKPAKGKKAKKGKGKKAKKGTEVAAL